MFLNCHYCGETPIIKSNRAIQEELLRLSSYLRPKTAVSCPKEDCPNHHVPVGDKQDYYAFGSTEAGSQRYRCRACGKTFSVKQKASLRHRKPHKNLLVFQLLVNKTPFRRISEVAGISGFRPPAVPGLREQPGEEDS